MPDNSSSHDTTRSRSCAGGAGLSYMEAMLLVKNGARLRRACWPSGWRIWLADEYRKPECESYWTGGLINGWGRQIGCGMDSPPVVDKGRDGMLYDATDKDMNATDWELLDVPKSNQSAEGATFNRIEPPYLDDIFPELSRPQHCPHMVHERWIERKVMPDKPEHARHDNVQPRSCAGGAVSEEEVEAASDAWEKVTGRIAYSDAMRAALEAATKVRERK